MVYIVVSLTLVFILLIFYVQGVISYRKYTSKIIKEIQQSYGKKSRRKYSKDELDNIKRFYEKNKTDDSIDDITSNDLDIDAIFTTYNFSSSAPGDDYFYYRLRTPDNNFANKEDKIRFVDKDEAVREKLNVFFYNIGRIRKISFIDFLNLISDSINYSLLKEIFHFLLVFVSIGIVFFDSSIGIAAIVLTLAYNIITYYKERGIIEPYIIGFSYIYNLIKNCKNLKNLDGTPLSEDIKVIKDLSNKAHNCIKYFSLLSSSRQTGAGNPLDILMDYFRMIFHIDIIVFYIMYERVTSNIDCIYDLYYKIGELESYINISSLRRAVEGYCIPEFSQNINLKTDNIYHPLINKPVKNNFEVNNNVLITGSNASGKSTFLRAIAINMITAKTINTCFADSFKCTPCKIFSSMSLKDDLSKGDSYFMAEIKAFKRIVDYCDSNPDVKICAFTDELLRGTNTIERVSACTSILSSMAKKGVFVFAATHDMELTDLLTDEYLNFHFDEEFVDDDIVFNYKIKEGKATSKNAIKLLHVMGFEDAVVNDAVTMSDKFVSAGIWERAKGK